MTAIPQRELNRLAKQRRILDAALSVFAAEGYSGTSMDAIAAKAAVSKPTLYQYFGTKEQLFTEIMLAERNTMLLAFDHPGTDMVAELHSFAWHYADTVMRPEFLSLARLIIGEAQRFPEIGRAYQAAGPDRVLAGMITYLTRQRDANKLTFDDAELAAEDLWGLILSAPRNQALHLPDRIPTKPELARYINNGLRVFLKAYATDPARDLAQLQTITGTP
ncbi:MAG: TetR/AcrR family transcriptional regulator [Cypionkella sp.]|uniref:TetR/AcrR family transcriptional regulator n=1 Tax=Cypionkella sp. TaxID=2811411 RepID=UPI002ABBAEEE|nr:TetR/AcrR family transcriptional regulator [Cypionkella sp.]MDZ4309380.1 TetR/AcrR family transcriptional regulator [Cypionkella sp.]MDZ4394160.1 TetR/AcrR family transcriptional regulator [Cypionkella sp.]